MIVFANISTRSFKKLIEKRSIKSWIYLGNDYEQIQRFTEILGPDVQEVQYARELYRLSQKLRRKYVQWIDKISYSNKLSKKWLFSVPAVKNPYSSQVFLNLCYFMVIKQFIEKQQKIDCVVIESPALGKLLARQFSDHFSYPGINHRLQYRIKIRKTIKSFLRYGKFFTDTVRSYVAAKLEFGQRVKKMVGQNKKCILIRNYITGQFNDSKQDIFERHFFPELGEYYEQNDCDVMYLPVVVNASNYRELYQKIQSSKKKIVVADEFLKWHDLLYAFWTPVRSALYRFKVPLFNDSLNFSRLIREDFKLNITDSNYLMASLFFNVGKRMKRIGFNFEGIVNWSEFQSFEKGLVSGVRLAFPNIKLYGSQPFLTPPNHVSLFPSKQDRLLNIVPDQAFVLGKVGKRAMNEYIQDMTTVYSPAFRYRKIFEEPKQGERKNLLLLFGYGLTNALYTLKILLNIKEELDHFENIYIKLHPASYFQKDRLVKDLGGHLPEKFQFISGQLEEYIDETAIGICGATGTAGELAVRGIPVILIAEKRALTMNYIEHRVDTDLWQLCFTDQEVSEAIAQFRFLLSNKPEVLQQKGLEFRKAYFAEPSDQQWENYLMSSEREYNLV